VRFGLSLLMQHPIGDDLGQRFAELLDMVRLARQAGFHHISASQHNLDTPFQYMQPLPMLARVAAEAGSGRASCCRPCSSPSTSRSRLRRST
jgi:hypothetical protein